MAVDMFLKIDGIDGESQDAKHTGEIDVLDWGWGMSQSGTMHIGTGGGGGKVSIEDISITKWVDKATPVLMLYCSNGDQVKGAKLTVRKAGGKDPLEYVVISMKNVIVTSIACGGSGGDDQLTENITLNFAEVKYDYQQQKADGSKEGGPIQYGWKIAENIKI